RWKQRLGRRWENRPFVTRQRSREPSPSHPGAAEQSIGAQRGNGTLALLSGLDNEIDGVWRHISCHSPVSAANGGEELPVPGVRSAIVRFFSIGWRPRGNPCPAMERI